MSLEMTGQQQQAVDVERTPRLLDPRTGIAYVLLRADDFERVLALLDEQLEPRDAYPAIDSAFAENWNDPKMDDYDDIPPVAKPRAGWEAAFKEMAERGDDKLLDGDLPSLTSWDEEEWNW